MGCIHSKRFVAVSVWFSYSENAANREVCYIAGIFQKISGAKFHVRERLESSDCVFAACSQSINVLPAELGTHFCSLSSGISSELKKQEEMR